MNRKFSPLLNQCTPRKLMAVYDGDVVVQVRAKSTEVVMINTSDGFVGTLNDIKTACDQLAAKTLAMTELDQVHNDRLEFLEHLVAMVTSHYGEGWFTGEPNIMSAKEFANWVRGNRLAGNNTVAHKAQFETLN